MQSIEGYEGLYSITVNGKVWSHERITRGREDGGKWLVTQYNKGYLQVKLSKKGNVKTIPIHRLVAEAFIPNPENKPCVNHKDGNPLNNNVSNLEWVTRSEDVLHAIKIGLIKIKRGEEKPNSKLTEKKVLEIRNNHVSKGIKQRKPWEKYNISFQLYYGIVNGTRWGHIQ